MTKRIIRVEGDVAYIPLTKGYEAIVDAKDLEFLSWWSWYACEKPTSTYAMANGGGKNVKMHRLLLSAPDGLDVDHINRNGLDNRRTNLRLATRAQNLHNSRGHSDSKSGLKGTTFIRAKNRWKAQIMVRGKLHHLGSGFKTAEEAHEAYRIAAKKLHGEFALLSLQDGVN